MIVARCVTLQPGKPLGTSSHQKWRLPPRTLRLDDSDVHVWRARLDLPNTQITSLEQHLSEDERARATRLVFLEDRHAFVAARGILRLLLARYLGSDPTRLRFHYGSYGKPALAPDPGGITTRFNLSHSGDLALFAVTRRREVGVDVEFEREDMDWASIAVQFFTRPEIAGLRSLPRTVARRAFFSCWCRKEALLKATGDGITRPLDSVVVPFTAIESTISLGSMRVLPGWRLQDLNPRRGYSAAVAVEGHDWRLTRYAWPQDVR